jgi:hypothetical protein
VIARARSVDGDVALFAHGHVLRVLVARWLGLPAGAGQHFLLDTGTLNVLGYYRGIPAVKTWNAPMVEHRQAGARDEGDLECTFVPDEPRSPASGTGQGVDRGSRPAHT